MKLKNLPSLSLPQKIRLEIISLFKLNYRVHLFLPLTYNFSRR